MKIGSITDNARIGYVGKHVTIDKIAETVTISRFATYQAKWSLGFKD